MNTSPVLQSVAAPNPRFIHRLAHTWKSCAHTHLLFKRQLYSHSHSHNSF